MSDTKYKHNLPKYYFNMILFEAYIETFNKFYRKDKNKLSLYIVGT